MTSGSRPRPPAVPRLRHAAGSSAPLLVRGDYHDLTVDRDQCEAFLRRFADWGRYGLSAYAADTLEAADQVAADYLVSFGSFSIFSAVQLVAAGFEVVATFRSPHMTIAFAEDLDQRLLRLAELRLEVRRNPYHEA